MPSIEVGHVRDMLSFAHHDKLHTFEAAAAAAVAEAVSSLQKL